MEVKFTLTPNQVSQIQRAARAEFDKATVARDTAIKAYQEAEKAKSAASETYYRVSGISSTKQYTVSELENLTRGVPGAITLTSDNFVPAGITGAFIKATAPEPPKNQPVLPKQVVAYYSFPSYSKEGAGHEVVIGKDAAALPLKTSCNCTAGVFGRECWAQRATKKSATSSYAPSTLYATGRPTGNRVLFPAPGFGTKR